MNIESIAGVGAAELSRAAVAASHSPASEGTYESMVSAVTQLNQDLQAGEQHLQKIALGGGLDDLHHTVMGMERTRLTLQLLLQMRSRALDAYSELVRMQI